MKKVLAILALCILAASLVFCDAASGKVFPLGDDLYDLIDVLFVHAGNVQPSTSRPWTAAEARNELSKLEACSLDGYAMSLYERLCDYVGQPEEGEGISVSLKLSPEAYCHTNEDYSTDEMWSYSFNERNPFMTLSLEAYLGSFYTYSELVYGWGRTTNRDSDASLSEIAAANGKTWNGLGAVVPSSDGGVRVVTSSDVYSRTFLFNFPDINQIEIDTPRQTFLTFASDHISFGYYKGRKTWGTSTIGNFIYDDHVSVYNCISLKVFGQRFAFDYSFMIPAQAYSNNQTSESPAKFRRVFASHRLDWYALRNLTFTASENVMYRFDTMDIDILNPAGIYHNNTNSTLLNAIAHLEVQYVPLAGWRLFGQFVLDQATAPTESDAQDPAWGISGGFSYARLDSWGSLSVTAEGAYTTPALYRRNNVDFIIWTNNSTNRPYTRYPVFTYMGFRYGGGVVAAKISADYRSCDGLEVYSKALVVMQGQFGMLDSHSSTGDNSRVPDLRLKTLSGEYGTSCILEAGLSKELKVHGMPAKAFLDVAWLSGVNSWYGAQGQDVQVSLGVSLEASSK